MADKQDGKPKTRAWSRSNSITAVLSARGSVPRRRRQHRRAARPCVEATPALRVYSANEMSTLPKRATAGSPLQSARRTLEIEARAVEAVAARLDDSFARAVDLILACSGRVVVSGIG